MKFQFLELIKFIFPNFVQLVSSTYSKRGVLLVDHRTPVTGVQVNKDLEAKIRTLLKEGPVATEVKLRIFKLGKFITLNTVSDRWLHRG